MSEWTPSPGDRVLSRVGATSVLPVVKGTVLRWLKRHRCVRVQWDDGWTITAGVDTLTPLDLITTLGDIADRWRPKLGERVQWTGPKGWDPKGWDRPQWDAEVGILGTVTGLQPSIAFVLWDNGDGIAYRASLLHLEPIGGTNDD